MAIYICRTCGIYLLAGCGCAHAHGWENDGHEVAKLPNAGGNFCDCACGCGEEPHDGSH
ncbi:hypothetical protein LCGC14_0312740 [marine sediment metagenome]|uniref:Uncharacterized protein n=1 Tax=marine sediment metagenome TaxID=412755 RepID=A0A0F9U3X0_9ZZZZ